MKRASTYTVLTCHYGDPAWVTHTLNQVDRLSGPEVKSVVVVDQSRESNELLKILPRVERVIVTRPDLEQVAILGHDHPAALDQAVHELDFDTDRIIVLDSDCFPLTESWLDSEQQVRLAADPSKFGLSHPCFMDIPNVCRNSVNFSDGVSEVGIDTGRLVGLQLVRDGYDVEILQAKATFKGLRGHVYADGRIYHHGSASFAGHPDTRLSLQVNSRRETFFRQRVMRGDFSIPTFKALRWSVTDSIRFLARPQS